MPLPDFKCFVSKWVHRSCEPIHFRPENRGALRGSGPGRDTEIGRVPAGMKTDPCSCERTINQLSEVYPAMKWWCSKDRAIVKKNRRINSCLHKDLVMNMDRMQKRIVLKWGEFWVFFFLKDNCFTEFCFLSNLNKNQSQIYIYFLPPELPPISHPIPPL